MTTDTEDLLYGGQSPSDAFAFHRYLMEVERGKSLLQLQAVAASITPEIRQSWAPQSFTPVRTSAGTFDAVVCNISYHFHKRGREHGKYGSIQSMTTAARRYFDQHQSEKLVLDNGLWRLPNNSLYKADGRIVTFLG